MPERNESYYVVNIIGSISKAVYKYKFDEEVAKHTKVFKTEEEAKLYAKKKRVKCELEKFTRKFVYGEDNWTIGWNYDEDRFCYTFATYVKRGHIYFESEEKAQETVRAVGEDRVKKYYLEVE